MALVLTDDNFYWTPQGEALRGGNSILYRHRTVIRVHRDGSHTVIKDHDGLSPREIEEIVNPPEHDARLLLML